RQGLSQAITPALADQDPRLGQGAHALFQEERIALSACNEQVYKRRQARVVPEQGVQKLVGAHQRQRIKPQLRVVRLATPSVLVLRTIVHQQQEMGSRQALDQAAQQGLRLRVDPVQILKHQQQWLRLAFAQHQTLEGIECALAPLRWIELQERAVLRQGVQQCQQW